MNETPGTGKRVMRGGRPPERLPTEIIGSIAKAYGAKTRQGSVEKLASDLGYSFTASTFINFLANAKSFGILIAQGGEWELTDLGAELVKMSSEGRQDKLLLRKAFGQNFVLATIWDKLKGQSFATESALLLAAEPELDLPAKMKRDWTALFFESGKYLDIVADGFPDNYVVKLPDVPLALFRRTARLSAPNVVQMDVPKSPTPTVLPTERKNARILSVRLTSGDTFSIEVPTDEMRPIDYDNCLSTIETAKWLFETLRK